MSGFKVDEEDITSAGAKARLAAGSVVEVFEVEAEVMM